MHVLDHELDGVESALVVLGQLDGVDDVHGLVGVDVLEVGGHVECDGVEHAGGGVVFELELDMLQVLAHELGGAEVEDAAGHEDWLLVAGAEGVELLEQGQELGGDVGEGYAGVDDGLGGELVGTDVLCHVFLEAAGELGDVLFAQGEADGVGVSAEVLQQVADGVDGGVDVEALDGAGGAGDEAVGVGEHDGGLVVELRQARGNDAYDALVPVGVVYDNGALAADDADVAGYDVVGFQCDALIKLLAVLVVLVDGSALLVGVVEVAADHEVDGLYAALHAAGGVDAGTDLEDDVADGDLLVGELAGADYGAEAEVGVEVDAAHAVVGHDAVLAHDGDDVGGDADGNQVEQRLEFVVVLQAVAFGEGLHELEADAAAAEVLARVGTPLHLGVEDGDGGGQLWVGHVVVADDEVDAAGLGVGDLFYGLDAAVEHYDEPDAALGGVVYALAGDAVPLLVAGGDVVLDVGVVVLEILVDERYGGSAVDVVVAVDHDALLGAHGLVEAVHGLVHAGHKEGVVQVGQGGGEELFGLARGTHMSAHEELGDGCPDAGACVDVSCGLALLWCEGLVVPFAFHVGTFLILIRRGCGTRRGGWGRRRTRRCIRRWWSRTAVFRLRASSCRGARRCRPR